MTSVSGATARLHNLDYLRGVAAFGIMIYHYLTWSFGSFPAETFLGRIGLYGVSIFYVLSGLTLFHVYFNSMTEGRTTTRAFFIKRVFRIFPLLWLVTLTAVVLARQVPNMLDLFLNLTGLFGFVKWDTYFSAGVWSIGNELVFYVLFPLIMLAARTRTSLLIASAAALLAPYVYFAFFGITPDGTIVDQWSMYVNPLNQAFLFIAGFAVGYFLREKRVPQFAAWVALVAAVSVFALWPAEGDPVALITGMNRMVLTLACIVMCAAIYKLTATPPPAIHVSLSTLGEASYSVYLIHPIVWLGVSFLFAFAPAPARIVIAVLITLAASYVCYRYFERYFVKMGQRVAAKVDSRSAGISHYS